MPDFKIRWKHNNHSAFFFAPVSIDMWRGCEVGTKFAGRKYHEGKNSFANARLQPISRLIKNLHFAFHFLQLCGNFQLPKRLLICGFPLCQKKPPYAGFSANNLFYLTRSCDRKHYVIVPYQSWSSLKNLAWNELWRISMLVDLAEIWFLRWPWGVISPTSFLNISRHFLNISRHFLKISHSKNLF